MDENNNFSDIPALGDAAGLDSYLQQEALAAQGIQPVAQEQPAAEATPTSGAGEVTPVTPAPQPAGTSGLTQEQLAEIAANVQKINAGLNAQRAPQPQPQPQPQPVQRQAASQPMYTPQEQAFIRQALAQGYGLDQINATIARHRGGYDSRTAALAQQVNAIQQYLATQEYQQAETAFIGRLSSFGEKFGLSEQDLVTFGNEALNKGINIAMPNVDLETVFRAVYPEQYRIRTQRMSPTNSSQIYGGTSIPEGNRAQSARMEDAYVNSFLAKAMPSQFNMSNKK